MKTTAAIVGVGAAVALGMGLSGCSAHGEGRNDSLALAGSKYCTAFRMAPDPASAFDGCLHGWAYTLAPAHDPADVVARAAVNACSSILASWNQQTLNQNPPASQKEDQGRAGGQPNSALAQRMSMVESRALFYVVQARAAGCAPPPADTLLATAGSSG